MRNSIPGLWAAFRFIQSLPYTHTCIHAYIHTRIHTYTLIYTQIQTCIQTNNLVVVHCIVPLVRHNHGPPNACLVLCEAPAWHGDPSIGPSIDPSIDPFIDPSAHSPLTLIRLAECFVCSPLTLIRLAECFDPPSFFNYIIECLENSRMPCLSGIPPAARLPNSPPTAR